MTLTEDHKRYLLSRGYVDQMIEHEPVCTIGAGGLAQLQNREMDGWIGWESFSMGGARIGVQTKNSQESAYRWFQAEDAQHLPIIYATVEDYQILWQTGEVILVEGIFDRVAIKRAFPEKAVIARLSKSVAKQLEVFLKRYARTVWLAMDMDEPGREGAEQAVKRLKNGIVVERLTYPAKDPAKLLENKGVEKVRELLEKQMDRLRMT